MGAITRTSEVTLADAWANDDGGVSLEVGGTTVAIEPEEAIRYALSVYEAAVEAAEAEDDKRDAEATIQELMQRGEVVIATSWDASRPLVEVRPRQPYPNE